MIELWDTRFLIRAKHFETPSLAPVRVIFLSFRLSSAILYCRCYFLSLCSFVIFFRYLLSLCSFLFFSFTLLLSLLFCARFCFFPFFLFRLFFSTLRFLGFFLFSISDMPKVYRLCGLPGESTSKYIFAATGLNEFSAWDIVEGK